MPDSRQCSIAYIHEKIDIVYLMSGNCLILLNFKTWWGSGGQCPSEAEAFWQIRSNSSLFDAYSAGGNLNPGELPP